MSRQSDHMRAVRLGRAQTRNDESLFQPGFKGLTNDYITTIGSFLSLTFSLSALLLSVSDSAPEEAGL